MVELTPIRVGLRVGLALAAIAGAAAFSSRSASEDQDPQRTVVQESAGVTLIEIPVNVVGKDGKPVAGLKVEDFELFDEGKKQPISGMDIIDLAKPAASGEPGAAAAVPAAARRLWLLVFDLSYTSPSGLVRARDGARRFVTGAMKENDLAAVGTLSIDSGWRLLVNFTRDTRQIVAAIDTLGLTAETKRTVDPLSFAFTPPGPQGPGGPSVSGPRDADILENLRDLQRMQKQANDG